MQLRVPHQNAILLRRQLFRGWIDQNEEERPLNITSSLYLPWTIESHPSPILFYSLRMATISA